jgi:DNA modification methylase
MDLRNGDCLELMKDLDDNSVDLLFADLPYGGGTTQCKWDCPIDLNLFWKEAHRVCKLEAPMVFTCTTKFGVSLINSNQKNFKFDVCWVKSSPTAFLLARKQPMRKHEMIYFFYRKQPSVYDENLTIYHKHKFLNSKNKTKDNIYDGDGEIYGKQVYNKCNHASSKSYEGYGKNNNFNIYDPPLPNTVVKEEQVKKIIKTKCVTAYGTNIHNTYGETVYEPPLPNTILEVKSERGYHSTQKPTALMEFVIKYWSRENDVILDPTMGSGSTGEACKNLNRNFIGFEKDPEIYEVAFNRLIE